ncbi:hypothetical protein AMECASPLE_031631, partial [Ameca splendens]
AILKVSTPDLDQKAGIIHPALKLLFSTTPCWTILFTSLPLPGIFPLLFFTFGMLPVSFCTITH